LTLLHSSYEVIDPDVERFREEGVLVLQGLLQPEELAVLQRETLALVQRAQQGQQDDPVYLYTTHETTGAEVPYRVKYVLDKPPACRALFGQPSVLRPVERLQGPHFIPTWDSMVFKVEGAGASIPWHRDQGLDHEPVAPIFNVDFYLDASDATNCLWAAPGSHRFSNAAAQATVERLSDGGFRTDGAVALEMQPGDVLLHDILVVHGSPPARSGLRRVLSYEFRSAEEELVHGPHLPEYAHLKRRVLRACLGERAGRAYSQREQPYVYNGGDSEPPPTYRYPHAEYWRASPPNG